MLFFDSSRNATSMRGMLPIGIGVTRGDCRRDGVDRQARRPGGVIGAPGRRIGVLPGRL
jgi:hypothetical protein